MWRGDGFRGSNFHHADMRKGRGGKGLTQFLRDVGAVQLWHVESNSVLPFLDDDAEFADLVE
jgi:hypothetical protein